MSWFCREIIIIIIIIVIIIIIIIIIIVIMACIDMYGMYRKWVTLCFSFAWSGFVSPYDEKPWMNRETALYMCDNCRLYDGNII